MPDSIPGPIPMPNTGLLVKLGIASGGANAGGIAPNGEKAGCISGCISRSGEDEA
jgi:hypothetical protein